MSRVYRILAAAALAASITGSIAAPLAAQRFSDGYTFLKAVRDRDGTAAESVLANPSSTVVNTRDPSSGEGALHILVRGRDLTWLAYLLGRGARADLQTSDGTTPLGLAAQIGWLEGAQQLIARRANVNLANNRGETPLILAVHGRQLEMIRLLIGQGADPARTDSVAGYSALDYARQDRRDTTIARLLEAPPARRPEIVGPTR